ncbi:hypothetical protein ACWCXH_36880 [Kitasatospora sp. NPDC001660]
MGSIGTVQFIRTGAGTWTKPDDTYWASIAGREGGGPQRDVVPGGMKQVDDGRAYRFGGDWSKQLLE